MTTARVVRAIVISFLVIVLLVCVGWCGVVRFPKEWHDASYYSEVYDGLADAQKQGDSRMAALYADKLEDAKYRFWNRYDRQPNYVPRLLRLFGADENKFVEKPLRLW